MTAPHDQHRYKTVVDVLDAVAVTCAKLIIGYVNTIKSRMRYNLELYTTLKRLFFWNIFSN